MSKEIPGLNYVSLGLSEKLTSFGYKGDSDLVIAGTTENYGYPLRSEAEQSDILHGSVFMSHHLYNVLEKYPEIQQNGKTYLLTPRYADNAPTNYVGYVAKGGMDFLYKQEGLKANRLAKLVLQLHEEGLIRP